MGRWGIISCHRTGLWAETQRRPLPLGLEIRSAPPRLPRGEAAFRPFCNFTTVQNSARRVPRISQMSLQKCENYESSFYRKFEMTILAILAFVQQYNRQCIPAKR